MSRFAPKSIRAKSTLVAVFVTAVSMVLVVGITAYATGAVYRNLIASDLNERLDKAQEYLAEGDFEGAIASMDADFMQIIDENGKVIASTANAAGLAAIVGDDDDDAYEIDDFEIEEDDDDDGGDDTDERKESDADDGDDDDKDDDQKLGKANSTVHTAAHATTRTKAHTTALTALSSARLEGLAQRVYMACNPFAVAYAYAEEVTPRSGVIEASDALGNQGPYLVVKRQVVSPLGLCTMAAMTSLSPAVSAAQAAALVLAIVLVFALVFGALFTWRMTGRTLRPVREMSEAAASLGTLDLSERIPVPQGDRELSQLALTFNALLDRVEASMNEQKRFISDASHELKSPVAATRLMLETLREHPETIDESELLEDLTAENERLAGIIEDLLTLARQDEGRTRVNAVPIDLYDLCCEEAALRSTNTVKVDVSRVEPVVCVADAKLLGGAVRNLLENAVRYAVSRVELACSEQDGKVRIIVSDDGPGIPPESREHVFGRFVRLEEARDRVAASAGTGLGLSVVRGVCHLHGGEVRFVEGELGGATAVIEIPVDGSPQD